MISLPKGTKEFLVIEVKDKLENLTSLDDADSVLFDVNTGEDVPVLSDSVAETDGMNAFCLVDTSGMDEGDYELFLKIDIPPQRPVLGPYKFYVDDITDESPQNNSIEWEDA